MVAINHPWTSPFDSRLRPRATTRLAPHPTAPMAQTDEGPILVVALNEVPQLDEGVTLVVALAKSADG
ncbi:MAG: hypothetical protein DHS20C11_07340 [Lysobacteraceae bacterium]|nr:MAG: hypothetical protein DHS20C11_07340 [Xanthomonadaceae bacterium]